MEGICLLSKFGVRSNMIRLVKSNFSLYRICLISILIFYEIERRSYYLRSIEREELLIVLKNVTILFLIPLLLSVCLLLITYLRDLIENKKMFQGYYRDIIKQLSPVGLSYIDDYEIELKKDVTSTLLQLHLKNKINFVNGKIVVINKKMSDLFLHEQCILEALILKRRLDKKEFEKKFKKAVYSDLICLKLLKDQSELQIKVDDSYKTRKYIFMAVFAICLVIFASGVGALMHMTLTVFFISLFTLIFPYIYLIRSIKEEKRVPKNKKTSCLDSFMGGIVIYGGFMFGIFAIMLLPEILQKNQDTIIAFFEQSLLILSIVVILMEFYLIVSSNKLTAGGKVLKTHLLGIKLFLKDYSDMKNKDINEINLWDEYIIYAVVLNENKKIKRKLLKMMDEYFEDESREIEC